MNTIHKYQLKLTDFQEVEIFGLMEVLSIAEQYGQPVLYALVDKESTKKTKIEVAIVGTGNPANHIMDKEWKFMSTLNFQEGLLMFHFFIRKIK